MDEQDNTVGLMIVTALFPIIGVVGGIYYLIKGQGSKGAGLTLFGIFMWIFWIIILGVI
jgi:hypothetical protein